VFRDPDSGYIRAHRRFSLQAVEEGLSGSRISPVLHREMKTIMTRKKLDSLTYLILGAAIRIHRRFGPGLLESVYQKFLFAELVECGFKVASEQKVELKRRDTTVDTTLRCDFIVNDLIVVEIKAVEKMLPVHEAQLLTYMKLLKKPKGILINFNCVNLFKHGQKTLVNEFYSALPPS
jgi:GxxExxY protein